MSKYMFTAKWCNNCQVMKPIAKELGIEIIDIEKNPEYVDKYTIMSLPTFIKDKGNEFDAIVGILHKKILEEFYGKD